MRFLIYIFPLFFLFATALDANERYDRIVDISVRIDSSGERNSFVLSWINKDTNALQYIVSRKSKDENTWLILDTLDAEQNTFTDTPPDTCRAYEYGIIKTTKDTSYSGYGYIYTGYDLEPVYNRGIALLFVDEIAAEALSNEIERFESDLTGDGYFVIKKLVERSEKFYAPAVSRTKQVIEQVQTEYPDENITLILLGRVPVPYAGNTAWDGHQPDHSGAWAADLYYGVPRSYWKDFNILNAKPVRIANKNIPYDGKFDQSVISKNKLRMGRIDMYNLPFFKESEIELLRRYLNKNHVFRHRKFQPRLRALLDDGFGNYLLEEAVAACAWLNFSSLTGTVNVDTVSSYRYGMRDNGFLWSYGCNMGAYDNIFHTVYTEELAENEERCIFTMLLGSYAGDWDSKNNVLRGSIASKPSMLAAVWAGRPFLYFHQMALGEPIGYSVLVSQNNRNTYLSNGSIGLKGSHIALLGDPTLRMIYPAPPENFTYTNDTIVSGKRMITLQWEKPDDNIAGYVLFRADSLHGKFKRINKNLLTGNLFIDENAPPGRLVYMLRSMKRELPLTGSYYNLSQGVFCKVGTTDGISNKNHQLAFTVFPNPAHEYFNIIFHTENIENITFKLYDALGKTVINSQEIQYTSGEHTLKVDLSGRIPQADAGIYLLQLNIGGKIYFGKLLIIN